jgi:hypothetical protein
VIERDRGLLARLAPVNAHCGKVVLEPSSYGVDGGELPADGVRVLDSAPDPTTAR